MHACRSTLEDPTLPHLTAEELRRLQDEFDIETTLFVEADKSNAEFIRIATRQAPRLRGRNIGIFSKTAEWYPGEDSFTGQHRTLRAPTLRTTLGNIKRAVFHRRQSARHFYENIIIGRRVVDEVIVKDERLAAWRSEPVYWMPEISRPSPVAETPEEVAACARQQEELRIFLAANDGREPVLYFGDAAFYKGYDWFLEFIASVPYTCGIHAGRTYDERQRSYFQADVEALRRQLSAEGRLFEINAYVHTYRAKAMFFGAIRLYLTTHRLALSSSTVLQALEIGKPILVPDRGLLGHRVRANGLGAVYDYGNLADLRRKAEQLWNSDLTRFAQPAAAFWSRFSDAAVRSFFVQRLVRQ